MNEEMEENMSKGRKLALLVGRVNAFCAELGLSQTNYYRNIGELSGFYDSTPDAEGQKGYEAAIKFGIELVESERVYMEHSDDESYAQAETQIPVKFFASEAVIGFEGLGDLSIIINCAGEIFFDDIRDHKYYNTTAFKTAKAVRDQHEMDRLEKESCEGMPEDLAKKILKLAAKYKFDIPNSAIERDEESPLDFVSKNLPEDDPDLVNYLSMSKEIFKENSGLD